MIIDIQKVKNIEKQIVSIKGSDGSAGIIDGIVNIDKYQRSSPRILWLLKEAHDDPGGGGWSLLEFLSKDQFKRDYARWRTTFASVIYITFGILNDLPKWNLLPDASEISDILEHIAYVNVKKTPGGTKSNYGSIAAAYKRNRDLLMLQFQTYKPNLIIGGGTLTHAYRDLGIEENDILRNIDYAWYSVKAEVVYLDLYHPAQTSITQDIYYSSAVSAWQNAKKLLEVH